METGLLFGIVGTVVGFIGAGVGVWLSIRNTRTVAEQRFMMLAAALTLVFVGGFLAVLFLLPIENRIWAWAVYPFLLIGLVLWINRTQANLRGPR